MKQKRKGINGHGMRCCTCGAPVQLRSADGIYKSNPNGTMLYVCSKYPACDTYIRTHQGTKEPMGTMAGPELRKMRTEAHRYFNQIYLSGIMSKDDAYAWLADVLGATKSQAHIGYLGDYYCQVVIEKSKELLATHRAVQNRKSVVLPFPTKESEAIWN